MHYVKYTVEVYDNGDKCWFLSGERHREDGPAIDWHNGSKSWFLHGRELTEEEFNKKMNSLSCEGKIVEIEGKKYKLTEVQEEY